MHEVQVHLERVQLNAKIFKTGNTLAEITEVIVMEDISSLAFAGLYSLLILSMTFHFLLAIRIKTLKGRIERIESLLEKK